MELKNSHTVCSILGLPGLVFFSPQHFFKTSCHVCACSLTSGMYSSPILWKILLSCSHAVLKCRLLALAGKPRLSRQKAEKPKQKHSFTPGFQCFCSPHPGNMARKADWKVGQEPGWGVEKSTDRNKKVAGGRPKAQSKLQVFVSVVFDC